MKRRSPVSSVGEAVRIIAAADVLPPAHVVMRDGDWPFWEAVVRARAKADWNDGDLIIAAGLARAMSDTERWTKEIGVEGDVVENARGTKVANPKHALLEQAARRIMALRRDLQIHGYAANGEASVVGKRRAEAKKIEADSQFNEDDGLLARPSLQ